jgi:DNA-binding transcriptional LysR family regulator
MAPSALTLLRRLTSRARLRHMHALIVLDDLRSMSRAAETLGMSQPAMTQLVSELEQLLETKLFLRHSRGVEPTPAAQDLMPVARRILMATEEGAQRLATRMLRDSGPVRVAATAAAVSGLLDFALPLINSLHPALQIQIDTVVGQSLDASFSGDEFDVVCCRLRSAIPDEWVFNRCIDDDFVIIAGASHPLAKRTSLTLEELDGETWLQNHVATIARHHFDDLRERMAWKNVQERQIISRTPMLILSMLREGSTLCLTPRSVAAPWLRDGSIAELPVKLEIPLDPIGFYWRPEQASPAVHQLVNGFEALMKARQGG